MGADKKLTSDDYEQLLRELGCGDNSCRIASPRGMATNGGCRCGAGRSMMHPLDTEQAVKLWRALQYRRAQVRALMEERAELRRLLAQAERPHSTECWNQQMPYKPECVCGLWDAAKEVGR